MKTSFLQKVILVGSLLVASAAQAGIGGSSAQIRNAVASGSVDAIIAEVERTEALICVDCVDIVTRLTDHNDYRVREVAAWWFAKRPSLAAQLTNQMVAELGQADSRKVRNAADFLGAVRAFDQLPALAAAYNRSGVAVEARVAIVNAVGALGKASGGGLLSAAVADADPAVRRQVIASWRLLRGQRDAAALVPLLSDAQANVRADAAAAMGAYKQAAALATLQALVVNDADAKVRRNAAWALGKLGDRSSRDVLRLASQDSSPLVGGVARAALASLR